MYAQRPTKLLKRLVPPPKAALSQKFTNFSRKSRVRDSKLIKDSSEMSAVDEGIFVNKPRISQKCQSSMSDKNQAMSMSTKVRPCLVKKPSFEVKKVIKQVRSKRIEWIDVEKLETFPNEVSALEMETKMVIKRFETMGDSSNSATCESNEETSSFVDEMEIDENVGIEMCETEVNDYKVRNNVSPKVLYRLKTVGSVEKNAPRSTGLRRVVKNFLK